MNIGPAAAKNFKSQNFDSKNTKKGKDMSKDTKKTTKAETKTEAKPADAPAESEEGAEFAPDLVPITISKEQFAKMKDALLVKEEINERARKIGTEIKDKSLKSAVKVAYKDGAWGIEMTFTDDSKVCYPKTSRTKKLLFEIGLGEDPAIEAKRWRDNYAAKHPKKEKVEEKAAEEKKA